MILTQTEEWIIQGNARIAEIRESLKDDTLTADEREELLDEENKLEVELDEQREHQADMYYERIHNHWD